MKVKFTNTETRIVAKVSNSSSMSTNPNPVVVKNQFREYQINSIQDLPDVDEINVAEGSTVVYNETTGLYEIKHLTVDNIDGPIDEGEF